MTKDGVSIKGIRDAKKAAAEVNTKLPNDKRFFSNGLSKTKITPPVMLQRTPPVKNPPVIDIADDSPPSPSPPALSTHANSLFDPVAVAERKRKLCRQVGTANFSGESAPDSQDKALYKRLLTATPSKTVKSDIGNLTALKHDTPTALRFLKSI
jgi:hypothetical protein